MRFGVIGDIHGNLVALKAVLDDLGPIDQLWCLGDIVGYGPQPDECIQAILDLDHVSVMGNHDAAVIGRVSTRDFNEEAERSIKWSAQQLHAESRRYLRSLPDHLSHSEVLLVHGSPGDPIWEYITTEEQALEAFKGTSFRYIWVAHTHVPTLFIQEPSGRVVWGHPENGTAIDLSEERLLINPGSVGQPRDGDPRAAYALLDTDQGCIEFRRIEYDIQETQRLMRSADISQWLIERISYGR